MKKIALLLCFVLLLSSVLPLCVAAEDTGVAASASLDSNLIRHYNFLDVVSGTRPKDVTESSNTNTKYSLYPSSVTTENGVGKVSRTAKSYYSCGDKDDLIDLSAMTVFLAFKPEGTPTGSFANVFEINGLLNAFIDVKGLGVRTSDEKMFNDTRHPVTMGKYVFLAISLDFSDSSKIVSNLYVSVDSGKTYTLYSKEISDSTSAPSKIIKGIYLGKLYSNYTKDGILDFTFDDFRIYNKALTQAEVESIQLDATPTIVPKNISSQERINAAEKKFDIRFCAVIDSLKYESVGFEIVAKDSEGTVLQTFSHSCTSVYESVMALGSPVTAESLGGKYLIAFAIRDIPESAGDVTFEIRSVAVKDGHTYYSDVASSVYSYSALAAGN